MATRIRDLAAQHHAVRERVDRRQRPMTPRENLDWASLGDTLLSWWAPHPDAILPPPKPETTPSATILPQRVMDAAAPADAGTRTDMSVEPPRDDQPR
jgi:hypothetical protein